MCLGTLPGVQNHGKAPGGAPVWHCRRCWLSRRGSCLLCVRGWLAKAAIWTINNAGNFATKDFWNITDGEWQHTFDVNVMSNVWLCRQFLKPMLERNQGRVILIASEAGVRIIPAMLHYSVSKTAQIGLVQGLAQLAKGSAVTVNSMVVGPSWTEGVERYVAGIAEQSGRSEDTEATAYFTENERTSLLQRFLQPDEASPA
ncbi:hypothetical protein WJX81_004108 [Elliptochloris bilobata]|uniref:Uncharacterized protein n=1 Tax=Elliptochloris bilobata TaxID=381761 RepID=A0AAW1QNP3_9CHLO